MSDYDPRSLAESILSDCSDEIIEHADSLDASDILDVEAVQDMIHTTADSEASCHASAAAIMASTRNASALTDDWGAQDFSGLSWRDITAKFAWAACRQDIYNAIHAMDEEQIGEAAGLVYCDTCYVIAEGSAEAMPEGWALDFADDPICPDCIDGEGDDEGEE